MKLAKIFLLVVALLSGCGDGKDEDNFWKVGMRSSDPIERGMTYISASIVIAAIIRLFK